MFLEKCGNYLRNLDFAKGMAWTTPRVPLGNVPAGTAAALHTPISSLVFENAG